MKKFLPGILFFLFLFCLFSPVFAADVVINEFSSATNPEWVELYNLSSTPVSLDGWTLFFQDDPGTSQKTAFGPSDSIPGNGYKVVEHTQSWLNNDGDIIILKSPSEENSVRYGNVVNAEVKAPNSNQSAARYPDGVGAWIILEQSTPNSPVPTFTPTPIPTNTPTLTPTPFPTATKTPTPSKTPTPAPQNTTAPINTPTVQPTTSFTVTSVRTPTPKITSKPTTKLKITEANKKTATSSAKKISPTITGTVKGAKTSAWKKDLPKILIIFGILSIGAMVGTSFFFSKVKT